MITLEDMIECAERELMMRERVYPNWVAAKRMSHAKAEREIALMTAIIGELRRIDRGEHLL